VVIEGAARLVEAHVEKTAVIWPPSRHHYVVDRYRQVREETIERSRIGKDELGSLRARAPRRFKPDAGATAYHDDGLAEQFGLALDSRGAVCVLMIPPICNPGLLRT
jgi:hypothetical protein